MKKKGFTLIELLAVIVILAVIALIATPLVLNTIDKAKKGAAKASALEYMNAVELYIVSSMVDTTKPQLQAGVEYQLSSTNYEVAALADPNTVYINDLIEMKGDKPESGYLIVNNQGTVEEMEMVMNKYPVMCANKDCEVVEDTEEEKVSITQADLEELANAIITEVSAYLATDENASTYTKVSGMTGMGSTNIGSGNTWFTMEINVHSGSESKLVATPSFSGYNLYADQYQFTVENGEIKDGTVLFSCFGDSYGNYNVINVVNGAIDGQLYQNIHADATQEDSELATNDLINKIKEYLATDENASTYTEIRANAWHNYTQSGWANSSSEIYISCNYINGININTKSLGNIFNMTGYKAVVDTSYFTIENGEIKDGYVKFKYSNNIVNVENGEIVS